MSTFASLARRCATSLVAAQLVFGAVSVTSPALAAAPDQGWTLEQHGTWKSFTTTINGRPRDRCQQSDDRRPHHGRPRRGRYL